MRATEIGIPTEEREQLLDVTSRIGELVAEHGWREGVLYLVTPHTTAGVVINENADPDVAHDILAALQRIVPKDSEEYKHSEGNSDAHIKSSLVGTQVFVPVQGGKLQLGRWQGLFLAEFDGPRDRMMRLYFLED